MKLRNSLRGWVFTTFLSVLCAFSSAEKSQAATGSVKWSSTLAGGLTHSSPGIAPDGTVYVGGADGKLYAFNPASATPSIPKWTFNTAFTGVSAGAIHSSPVINRAGTRVIFGSDNGRVYCVNVSGAAPALVWSFSSRPGPNNTARAVRSTPTLRSSDEAELYVNAADGFIYGLNAATGSLLWEMPLEADPNLNTTITFNSDLVMESSPAVTSDGAIYFVGDVFGKPCILNSATPTAIAYFIGGSFNTFGGTSQASVAMTPDGLALLVNNIPGSSEFDVVAMRRDGTEAFRTLQSVFNVTANIQTTPVVDSCGNFFFGSDDGKIYSATATGGSKSSPITTGGKVRGSGAIAADGKIWFASADNKLYVLNPSGTLNASFSVLAGGSSLIFTASSPAIGQDGTVYVVDASGTLRAVEGTASPAAPGFWPNFRMNNRHTADVRNNRWTDSAVTSVTVVLLDGFPATGSSQAYCINDCNQVVGQYYGYLNYPINTPIGYGAYQASPFASAITYSSAPYAFNEGAGQSINNSGDLCGWISYSGGQSGRGFIKSGAGVMTWLTAAPGFNDCWTMGLNNNKTVVGFSKGGSPTPHSTRWVSGTTAGEDLGSPPWSTGENYAYGINTAGQIIGKAKIGSVFHGFAAPINNDPSSAQEISSYAGSSFSCEMIAIDEFGQVTGNTQISSTVTRPGLRKLAANTYVGGAWIIPSLPSNLTGNFGTARGINNRNQVVGEAWTTASQSSSRAFIWIPDTSNPKNLNDYLTSGQAANWVLNSAYSINDQGRIVGWGTYTVGGTSRTASFLLYPN